MDKPGPLRKDGLKAPVAGGSHWRRDREFSETQATAGLDLIDDRLFWSSPLRHRGGGRAWSLDGGMIAESLQRKRKADRPYVVGQWCENTHQGVPILGHSGRGGQHDVGCLVGDGPGPLRHVRPLADDVGPIRPPLGLGLDDHPAIEAPEHRPPSRRDPIGGVPEDPVVNQVEPGRSLLLREFVVPPPVRDARDRAP